MTNTSQRKNHPPEYGCSFYFVPIQIVWKQQYFSNISLLYRIQEHKMNAQTYSQQYVKCYIPLVVKLRWRTKHTLNQSQHCVILCNIKYCSGKLKQVRDKLLSAGELYLDRFTSSCRIWYAYTFNTTLNQNNEGKFKQNYSGWCVIHKKSWVWIWEHQLSHVKFWSEVCFSSVIQRQYLEIDHGPSSPILSNSPYILVCQCVNI